MIHNICSNNQISFLLSKHNSIDLEALNMIAGKTEQILCSCSYCEHNGKHKLDYDVCLSNNMCLQSSSFLMENLVGACLDIFDMVERCNLNLVNFRTNKKFIFKNDEIYQFIYIPLLAKKTISKKKFVVKLFAQFIGKDSKVTSLLKRVKGLKTDATVVDCLREYVNFAEETSIANAEDEIEFFSESVVEAEGETTILSQHTTEFLTNDSAECETTFLSETPFCKEPKEMMSDGEYTLFLLRVGTGEQIHINKSQYSIGKDIQTMDYVLGNQSVSRNHATIYIEDNRFYLTDNESTNGTTIEGIRVQVGERAELSDGDIISLGNEVFQVLLERK